MKDPPELKKIRVHFICDANHDDNHKVRVLVDDCLTITSLFRAHYRVVSLKGIALVLFLPELNGLESWGSGIGRTYLEAKIKEKVCIIARPEFNLLNECALTVTKDLHGMLASGLRWHERLADYLRSMGF